MGERPVKSSLAATLVVLASSIVCAAQPLAPAPGKEASRREKSADLRNAFRSGGEQEASALIASMSIMLLDETSGVREVRVDHPFRSGNKFRFVVTSNRHGWLYIFHRTSDGKTQQVWPPSDSQAGFAPHQEVNARQSYLIPPSPAMFVFDDQVGQEEFIISIISENTAPDPHHLEAITPLEASGVVAGNSVRPRNKTTGNIVIRGDPFRGGLTRGIYLDPGTDDPDPRLYFSAAPGDDATKAVIRFRLRHAQ